LRQAIFLLLQGSPWLLCNSSAAVVKWKAV